MSTKLAYTQQEAAEATGLSVWTIKRAVNSGDLASNKPEIEGRKIEAVLIPADELARWALGTSA